MTEMLKDHTRIPNWAMGIFLVTLIGFFSSGWVKVDNLEKEVIRNKEQITFRIEQMSKIDKKLDEILYRLRELETKRDLR